jgi:hypothetical protein
LLNNTATPASPPYFVSPPTLPDGSYIPVIVNTTQIWYIMAASNSSIEISITSSSLPQGNFTYYIAILI